MMKQPVKVEARVKKIIEVDGLKFKDLNGNGKLDPYEDWRLSPEERAEDLVRQMSPEEKAGLMVINSRPMGLHQKNKSKTSHDGILDEENSDKHPRFGHLPGTTEAIEKMKIRHFLLRETPKGSEIVKWINAMNEVAEGTRLGIPVLVASNSRNENGGFTIANKKDAKDFTQWPGTLGLSATGDLDLISDFAEKSRKEWDATGIKKGYMYMADVTTDPRWFRINGTLGEDPEFIAKAITRLIKGFQGEELGPESIAMTTKHFPGGGARENGFDPHYAEGKYNCYPTPGSLENYHLPPFIAAIKAGTSSIMPYYAIPSNQKSAVPQSPVDEEFEEVGFVFNKAIIHDLLRGKLGFKGYINSDSGVLTNMAWGVENLTVPERVAKGVSSDADIFADTNDVQSVKEAYMTGLISHERLNLAAKRLTMEMFRLGLFDNPYRDPEYADEIVDCKEHRDAAYKAHQKSVVLLKNKNQLLPLTHEKLAGKRVYLEFFEQSLSVEKLEKMRADLVAQNPDIVFTTDYAFADVAILFIKPFTGAYFDPIPSELNIFEDTFINLAKIKEIRKAVPNVVMSVNFMMPWLLTNVEPLADALLGGFETFETAVMDVVCGRFHPTGTLPITLPGSDEAIAIDENGLCASPNDVPGFDKAKYMNGKPYDYVDSEGNKYRLGFGLSY